MKQGLLLFLTLILTGALFAWAAKGQNYRVETEISKKIHLNNWAR